MHIYGKESPSLLYVVIASQVQVLEKASFLRKFLIRVEKVVSNVTNNC